MLLSLKSGKIGEKQSQFSTVCIVCTVKWQYIEQKLQFGVTIKCHNISRFFNPFPAVEGRFAPVPYCTILYKVGQKGKFEHYAPISCLRPSGNVMCKKTKI